MPWRIRHQGSPRSVDNLTKEQITEGLLEEVYGPSDEVMGPFDKNWRPMEAHPVFADACLELEEAANVKPAEDPEEQRIDMNPLIDVCLVLLVFFILATTMSVLEKVLNLPRQPVAEEKKEPRKVTVQDVEKIMVLVKARRPGKDQPPVLEVEKKVVAADSLLRELKQLKQAGTKKQLLIDAAGVDWGTVVQIIDAAGGAGFDKVLFVNQTKKQGSGP
jgi:biopolymer transport protein ExbD